MGKKVFDTFSLLHFAIGIIAYYWYIPLKLFAIITIIFELIENSTIGITFIKKYMTFWPGSKFKADSFQNILSDIIITLLGWIFANYINKNQ